MLTLLWEEKRILMHKGIKFSALAMAGAFSLAGMSSAATAADGDAVAGKRVFMRCMACHTVKAGEPNKVGPNLAGVVGRKSGGAKGFRYSAAMSKVSLKWDEATLDKWLTRPASLVPGTSMVFAGLADAKERKAVIAYLKKPVP